MPSQPLVVILAVSTALSGFLGAGRTLLAQNAGPARAAGAAQAAPVVLLRGPADAAAEYAVHDVTNPEVTHSHRLTDSAYHLFNTPQRIRISFGTPRQTRDLEPGRIYEFRWTLQANIPRLQLVAQPMVAAPETREALARIDDLKRQIAALEARVADTEDQLRQEQEALAEAQREIERRKKAGTAVVAEAARRAAPIDPVELGPLARKDRRAEAEISVALPQVVLGGAKIASVTATVDRPYAEARATLLPAQGEPEAPLKVKLVLDNVASAAPLKGELTVALEEEAGRRTIVVPLRFQFRDAPPRLEAGPGVLTVVTFPPGARVCLTPLSDSRDARPRAEVGVTPVELAVPQGRYRVELLPPTRTAGRWVGPHGAAEPLDSTAGEAEMFVTSVAVSGHSSTLVRGAWLPQGLTSSCEQWEKAVAGGVELFPLADQPQLFSYAARSVAKASGAPPGEEEFRRLFQVLKKTGYLQFPIDEKLVLDLELAGKDVQTRIRLVGGQTSELPPFRLTE